MEEDLTKFEEIRLRYRRIFSRLAQNLVIARQFKIKLSQDTIDLIECTDDIRLLIELVETLCEDPNTEKYVMKTMDKLKFN